MRRRDKIPGWMPARASVAASTWCYSNGPAAHLARLRKLIRKDFPADDTMYGLHVLRACMPVRDGYAKIEDMLPAMPVVVASRR